MHQQKGIASYLIVFIALIGIAVSLYLVQNYTSFLPKASNTYGASLTLSPSQVTTGKGCELSFDINLDTGSSDTDGTDAILKYDPSILTISSIENGSIYPMYPGNKVDASRGLVTISGLSSPSSPVSGSGKFATIKARINPNTNASSTQLSFDFDPSNPYKTNDTNVVERGTISELLREVTNAAITINTSTSCNTSSNSPAPSPVASSLPAPSPSSVADLTVSLDSTSNHPRAIVSWHNVPNPSRLDKIEVYYSNFDDPGRKILTDWVYARTCTKTITHETTDGKSDGSCRINLNKSKVSYEFRYMLYKTSTTLTVN